MNSAMFEERKYLYLAKSFAILSVVCAHTARIPENSSSMNQIISMILLSLGSMGVPIFLIISGYLFDKNNKSVYEFFNTKISSIILPWMFCGTIVWLYVVLRKGGESFLSWLSFLLGVNHSTYYLTILILFFIFYFHLKKYNSFLIATILISIVSIVTTSMNLNIVNTITITPFLNPLNWMLYFSIGLLINRCELIGRIAILSRKLIYLSVPALIFALVVHVINGETLHYWSNFTLVNMTISSLVIFGLSSIFLDRSSNVLVTVGKYSFSIYLLHELVVGIIVRLSSNYDFWFITMLRPLIVLLIVMTGIIIYKKLVAKLYIKKYALMLIGIRE